MSYTMRQAAAIVSDSIENPLTKGHRVLFLEGPPGIGKTAMVKGIYQRHARTESNPKGFTHFIEYIAPEREPTDWGLPVPNLLRDAITMLPLDDFKFAENDRPCIFLDEIDKANNMMQNMLGRVMHAQQVGNITFPRGTFIIGAGNRLTDRTGSFVANAHIKGRRTTVPAMVDVKEWIEDVAIPDNLHPSVISFHRVADLLHKLDAGAPAYPSPRSWSKVGEQLNRPVEGFIERALIEGDIGVEAANTFWGHLKIFRALRSLEEIINDPHRIAIPSGKDATAVMWAEVTSLAKHTDRANADAIFTYFNRLPGEFAFCGYRDVMIREEKMEAKDKALAKSKAGQVWMVKNATLLQSTRAN